MGEHLWALNAQNLLLTPFKIGLHGSYAFGHNLFCLLHHICMRYCVNSWLGETKLYTEALFLHITYFVLYDSHINAFRHVMVFVPFPPKLFASLFDSTLSSFHHLYMCVVSLFLGCLIHTFTWFCCLFHPLILVSDLHGSLVLLPIWFSFLVY